MYIYKFKYTCIHPFITHICIYMCIYIYCYMLWVALALLYIYIYIYMYIIDSFILHYCGAAQFNLVTSGPRGDKPETANSFRRVLDLKEDIVFLAVQLPRGM